MPDHVHYGKVTKLLDADTFWVEVELDFYVRTSVKVRVKDYYAPELHEEHGMDALNEARGVILNRTVMIESYKDTHSFDRWICDVWFQPPGLGGEMLYKEYMDSKGFGGQGQGT